MNRFGPIAIGLTLTLFVTLALLWAFDSSPTFDEAPGATATSLGSLTTSTVENLQTAPETTTTQLSSTSKSTTSTVPSTTSTTVLAFGSSITTPTTGQLHASWRQGCPVAVSDLRLIEVEHWGYDDVVRTGEIVVAAELASQVVDIFEDLYKARFPIQRMELIEEYGGDDDSSMAANNTSGFNCREVTGGGSFSEHSYGRAIDINPLVNPYVNGSTVLPPDGSRYTDRSLDAPGMIHNDDEVVRAFESRGWIWAGTWTSLKDYQHFSTTGR